MMSQYRSSRSKPYDVLQSSTELRSLSAAWVTHNKARVYAAEAAATAAAAAPAAPVRGTPMHAPNRATTSVCVHLHEPQQPHPRDAAAPSTAEAVAARARARARVVHPSQTPPAAGMAVIEADIITAVCNRFLSEQPPYTGPQGLALRVGSSSCRDNDLVAHASTVHITRDSSATPLELAIPVAPPTVQQIAHCTADPAYNKNVLMTFAAALTCDSLGVTIGAAPSPAAAAFSTAAPKTAAAAKATRAASVAATTASPASTLYLSPYVVPRSMGCTHACEAALFGESRTTVSANFELGDDLASTYASAVQKYQKYSSVALGEHITLVPSFLHRAPLVVSMRCPQLDVAHVATTVSGSKNDPKFGPNHATRSVEVMGHVAPFVKACCEKYMALAPDTQEEVHEDDCMPVATCTGVEHAFLHDGPNGVSMCVGTLTFALPVAMLNSYAIDGGSGGGGGGATGQRAPFPVQHDIVGHTAAIFGGACTRRAA